MNIFLQLAVCLAVLFFGILIVSITQKRLKLFPIILLTITLALTVSSTFFGVKNRVEPADEDLYLLKIGKFVEQNNIDEASEILDELYYSSENDDPTILWYKARVEAIKGNLSLATYYYNEVMKDINDETSYEVLDAKALKRLDNEIELLEEIIASETDSNDTAVIEYLLDQGANLEEYYDETSIDNYYESLNSDEKDDPEEIKQEFMEEVYDNIEDDLDDIYDLDDAYEDYGEILDLSACVEDYYDGYVDFEVLDIKGVENIEDAIDTLEDYYEDDFGSEVDIEDILVEAYLESQDYDNAVDILTTDVSVENVAVLSELYIKGYIDEKDVDEVFDEIDEDLYEEVVDQYERVVKKLDNHSETEEEEAYIEHLYNIVEVMEAEEENIQLAQMQDYIEDELNEIDPSEKANYLIQSAKIDHYFEDEEGMKENIDEAIAVAPYCEDEELADGLLGLDEITDTENEDVDVRDIPEYVQQVVGASLVIDIEIPDAPIDYDDLSEDEIEELEEQQSFSQSMTNYISEKMVTVNINKIDTSNYPEITAYFQLGAQNEASYISNEDLANENVSLYDTGMSITDYSIEKIEYDESNFILLFDMSGSMFEEVNDLKDAGYTFIDDMGKDENVAIVGFSDYILMDSEFQDEDSLSELESYVEGIYADGGTRIYESANYCLDKFPEVLDANNVLIVMTDGQDGSNTSWSEISQTIVASSLESGVTVYTVGLGNDVDVDYLTMFAEAGNGKFVYVYDATSLDDFYDFLHGQITNQYKVTYIIENEEEYDRDIELAFATLDGSDSKSYQIYDETESEEAVDINSVTEEAPENNATVVTAGDVHLTGLNQQSIVKTSNQTYSLELIGAGFSTLEIDDISVELRGPVDIDMEDVSIVDDTHIAFTVPMNIIVGDYDIRLDTGKEKLRKNDVLSVVPAGNVKFITFGDYTIMANSIKVVGDEEYQATGNVNINNLVRFSGDLEVYGDYEHNDIISLYSDSFSYMTLDKECDAFFAQKLSDYNVDIPLGVWHEFRLYKDGTAEEIDLGVPIVLDNMAVSNPSIRLHPDYIEVEMVDVDFFLPFQDYLIAANVLPKYKFESSANMILMTDNIAFKGNLKIKSSAENGLAKMKVFKSSIMKVKYFNIDVDTLNGAVAGHVIVSLSTVSDTSFGLKLACEEWKLDAIELGVDYDVPICTTPVPTTLSDFRLGVSGLSEVTNVKELGKATFTGGADVNIGELEAVIPGIDAFLDDTPCILQVNDARASITIEDFALEFTGAVKLFEQLEMYDIEIVLGNYQYSEAVLNIDDEDVFGAKIKLASEIDFDFDPYVSVEASGSNTFYVNNRGLEIVSQGFVQTDTLIGHDISKNGKMFLAINKDPGIDRILFHVYVKCSDSTTNDTDGFYLILNKDDPEWYDPGRFYELELY